MSTIQRSVKRGNVRSFDQSYKMGFKSAWASEVDADFDILFNSWNLGLDGGLAIADNTITTAKLMDGAVTNPKLAPSSVGQGNLMVGAVGTTAIQDGSINNSKLGPQCVAQANIIPNSLDANAILIPWSITVNQLAANSVTAFALANLSVTTPKIALGAVTDAQISNVAWGKITGAPTTVPPSGPAGGSLQGTYPNPTLRANSITFAEILDGTVGIPELAPTVVARFVPAFGLGDDNKVLTVAPGGGGLLWVTTPPASLNPGQVSTIFIADAPNGVTDAKITSVSWSKVTGAPTSLPPGGPAGGDLVGTYPNPTLAPGLLPTTLPPTGPAGGDLIGTYPTPSLRDGSVGTLKIAPLAVTNAQVNDVAWSKITEAPTTLPPSGPAGGDLGGTFPNPTISAAIKSKWAISGAALTPIDVTKQVLLAPLTNPLVAPSLTTKARLTVGQTVDMLQLSQNRTFEGVRDDATKPAWFLSLRSDTDIAQIGRVNAAGAATQPFTVQGSDGKTYCTLADASVTRTMIASGHSVWTSGSVGIPVSFNSNAVLSTWIPIAAIPGIVVKAGQFVFLFYSGALVYTGNASGANNIFLRWTRAAGVPVGPGQVVFSTGGSVTGLIALLLPVPNCWDGPAAGTYTYQLEVFVSTNVGNVMNANNSSGGIAAFVLT